MCSPSGQPGLAETALAKPSLSSAFCCPGRNPCSRAHVHIPAAPGRRGEDHRRKRLGKWHGGSSAHILPQSHGQLAPQGCAFPPMKERGNAVSPPREKSLGRALPQLPPGRGPSQPSWGISMGQSHQATAVCAIPGDGLPRAVVLVLACPALPTCARPWTDGLWGRLLVAAPLGERLAPSAGQSC